MRSALMPAFSNKGATFFKYTSLASPFLLLGFITTFSLRGLLGIPKQEKKKKKKRNHDLLMLSEILRGRSQNRRNS